ncbi:MAG: hypothetical protein WKG01_11580 [Kofleriaceae bacterium]
MAETASESKSPAPAAGKRDRHEPDGDWDPRGPKETRPKPRQFRGIPLARPSEEVQVTLGHKHTQKYWISNADQAPEGVSYQWRHTIKGSAAVGNEVLYGHTGEGVSNELLVQPKIPGTKTITTTALQTGPDGKVKLNVEDVVVTTPAPKLQRGYEPVLESISKDGNRRPVLDTLAFGEDLLVTVRFELLGDEADQLNSSIDSSSLVYQSFRKLGPGTFELRLKPTEAGVAIGTLRVAPYETPKSEAPTVKLELNVEKLKTVDSAGTRPRDVSDVKGWLSIPMVEIFTRRRDALDNVYDQESKKDAAPKTPLWKTLLETAVTIAINSVTAGLGATIAGSLIADSDTKPLATELVKVLFEQTMSTAAVSAAQQSLGRGDDEKHGQAAPRESMPQKCTRCMSPVLFASSTFVHGGAHARAHESSERRAA